MYVAQAPTWEINPTISQEFYKRREILNYSESNLALNSRTTLRHFRPNLVDSAVTLATTT